MGGVSRPVRRRCRSRYLSQPSSRSSQSQQHAARWFLWPLRSTYSQQQRGSSIAARRPPSAAAAAAGPGTRPSRQRRVPHGSAAAAAARPRPRRQPQVPRARHRLLHSGPAPFGGAQPPLAARASSVSRKRRCAGGGVCVCVCERGHPPRPTHSLAPGPST